MNSKHILIAGAGASGLMAGCEFIAHGWQVTIVEARDRVGGRIHTMRSNFSKIIDAGAEFIHGKQELTMRLVRASKSELLRMEGHMYSIRDGKETESSFFDDDWGKVMKALHKLEEDTDMASFMNAHFPKDQYPRLNESITGFVQGYDAADLSKVSALALRDEWSETDEEHQYHIREGYGNLIQFLRTKLVESGGRIVLSSPVRKIHWNNDSDHSVVKFICEDDQSFEGDLAVITIPLGVLQRERVDFFPALDAHQKAFNMIGFGGVIKFILEFDKKFWGEILLRNNMAKMSFIFSDAHVPTWWSQLPDETPVITGWLGGPVTTTLSGNTEELYEMALTSLQYILKCAADDLKKNVRHWHIADWVNDDFSLGAYSYPMVQTKAALAVLSQPVGGLLYFAGEAFYEGPSMGTVEAALASGRDVAKKIISTFNR